MSSPGQQPPSGAPPGWYADPWAPGAVRWWSGIDWTSYTAPVGGQQTEGLAVASLITSLIGLTPVGIVLGFVARRRIKKDPQRKSGLGLATAGIATGAVFAALIGVIVVLAASGLFDEENADDFSGTDRDIALVVDRFETLWRDGKGERICSELFTPALEQSYQGACASDWGEEGYVEVDLDSISVTGDLATATGGDYDVSWRFGLVYVDGRWRISSVDSD